MRFIRYTYGYICMKQKRYDDASGYFGDFGKVAKSDDLRLQKGDAYNRMGDIYFSRNEYNSAIEQYRKAIGIAPKLSEAYRLLGRTYAEMGNTGKAIFNYQKAVEINKNDAETYCRIAELAAKQKQSAKEKSNYRRAARLGHKEAQQWCTKHGVTY